MYMDRTSFHMIHMQKNHPKIFTYLIIVRLILKSIKSIIRIQRIKMIKGTFNFFVH